MNINKKHKSFVEAPRELIFKFCSRINTISQSFSYHLKNSFNASSDFVFQHKTRNLNKFISNEILHKILNISFDAFSTRALYNVSLNEPREIVVSIRSSFIKSTEIRKKKFNLRH